MPVDSNPIDAPMDRVRDRVMSGETPLQAVRKLADRPVTKMTSLERFPYYTHFPFAWYRAAHAEEVAAGEVRPIRYLTRDLIVWREQGGTPHVMDAYCPHLGAHLGVGGRVDGCELVCPFHWWQFDGQGRNTSIPYDGSKNPSARIKTYPTVERNGSILFWYHPTDEPPLWQVPELAVCSDDDYTDYDRYEWKMPIPWQEFAENGPDFIHLRTVHGSVDIPELERLSYEGYFTELRSKVNFDTPRGSQQGRIDTEGWGPGFAIARFSGIIDAFFIAASTPIDFETLEVTHSYKIRKLGSTPDLLEKTRRIGEALVRDLVKQVEEDAVIFEHKISQPKPRLSPADGPILEFRDWAGQFYLPGDPRGTNR